jgi:hypothetical protein
MHFTANLDPASVNTSTVVLSCSRLVGITDENGKMSYTSKIFDIGAAGNPTRESVSTLLLTGLTFPPSDSACVLSIDGLKSSAGQTLANGPILETLEVSKYPPSVPLASACSKNSKAYVSWSHIEGATSYSLQWASKGGIPNFVRDIDKDTQYYTLEQGISPGSVYTVSVAAVTALGESEWSTAKDVTVKTTNESCIFSRVVPLVNSPIITFNNLDNQIGETGSGVISVSDRSLVIKTKVGFHYSLDKGQTFNRILLDNTSNRVFATDGTKLYAFSRDNQDFYTSTDGVNWTNHTRGGVGSDWWVSGAFIKNSKIYLILKESGSTTESAVESTDNGQTFVAATTSVVDEWKSRIREARRDTLMYTDRRPLNWLQIQGTPYFTTEILGKPQQIFDLDDGTYTLLPRKVFFNSDQFLCWDEDASQNKCYNGESSEGFNLAKYQEYTVP